MSTIEIAPEIQLQNEILTARVEELTNQLEKWAR